MFDTINIKDKEFKVFFDKDNFKLHIENDYRRDVEEYFYDKKIVTIPHYILFIDTDGIYNSSSIEYNVYYYIKCDYISFSPNNIDTIILKSQNITQLVYNKEQNDKKNYNYSFTFNDSKFNVTFRSSNKINLSKYYQVSDVSCIKIDIEKCEDWNSFNKVIQSILNMLSIIFLSEAIKNCSISIETTDQRNIGEICFSKKYDKEKFCGGLGNFFIFSNFINKIINTLYETPYINLDFIPKYKSTYNNFDYFSLYSCFEYEYSKIDKKKLYTKEELQNLEVAEQLKKDVAKLVNENLKDVSSHFTRYLSNYNPLEGHRQKLINGVNYAYSFIGSRLEDLLPPSTKEDFTTYIYKTRIKVVHNPNSDFKIEKTFAVSMFAEVIYALFLKRCEISNADLTKLLNEVLIPYA